VKVQIDSEKCQGHGRCYDLAPQLFGEDDEGYGQVIGDGSVSSDNEHAAQLAVSNCPENAITMLVED
jgi:ferredoxin